MVVPKLRSLISSHRFSISFILVSLFGGFDLRVLDGGNKINSFRIHLFILSNYHFVFEY